MKALVVYDSTHGNTEKVARAMGDAISDTVGDTSGDTVDDARVRQASDVPPADLQGYDLLIIGSPTHGGWFTEAVRDLLEASLALEGVNVAAFDTRTATIWNRILPFGYAAPRIARSLEEHGGNLVAEPEGFVVLGIKGPLKGDSFGRWFDKLTTSFRTGCQIPAAHE